MIHAQPFGKYEGFGEGNRAGEHYYSQGMSPSRFGIMPLFGVNKQKDSADISGLGQVLFFAYANGISFAVDASGKIYKEASGVYDFALDRTNGQTSHGNGLIGDQKGRLLYPSDTYLGMRSTAGVYTDNWKDFGKTYTGFRDADVYEDSVYIMNKDTVALLASDDSFNAAAFTFPTDFIGRAIRSGRTGLLMGANFGSEGVLALWDGLADRSIAPWIWTESKILAITRYKGNWIVITEREILITTGYAVERLFGLLDDPMGLGTYSVNPQGVLVVNDLLILLQQSSSFTRSKPGLLVFNLKTRLCQYVPISTLNTYSAIPTAISSAKGSLSRVLVGYRDDKLAKNYIGSLDQGGSASAVFISEELGRGSWDKQAEAVILKLGLRSTSALHASITFDVSVKLYNFMRPLWERHQTNTMSGQKDQVQVDGTIATNVNAQAGDEVTILEGVNAGQVRHIKTITGDGTNGETWTLDSALPNYTATSTWMNVQPFELASPKKTCSSLTELKDFFFNVKNKIRGKKYLVKVLFENMTIQPELHEGLFVYDDLGIPSLPSLSGGRK